MTFFQGASSREPKSIIIFLLSIDIQHGFNCSNLFSSICLAQRFNFTIFVSFKKTFYQAQLCFEIVKQFEDGESFQASMMEKMEGKWNFKWKKNHIFIFSYTFKLK